ncbi:Phosphatidylethanolamine N-methyltransferase [Fukomys damarensis]|uniref:Phosphatidylethanolamine N-methyltransferase n=1 Tax=Fukomys damarensis TaxID=885580 RepID=A0A091DBM9_FUKDA|nr:Phosphatidylethanolamine N-methyltransferase [Fukomys damarensis]
MSSTASGPDCCGGLGNINYRKADLCVMTWLLHYVDPLDSSFGAAVLTIAFNPFFWNVVSALAPNTADKGYSVGSGSLALGMQEATNIYLFLLPLSPTSHIRSRYYHGHQMSVSDNFSTGFTQAMLSQPKMEGLDNPTTYCLGIALLSVGTMFVLSSFFALGFTGTFLGDYFGILKEARVTTFPFSIADNPMYWGSTANYLGWALMHASPTGLLLTVVVALVYVVAILYEEPFTAEIYRQKAAESHRRR